LISKNIRMKKFILIFIAFFISPDSISQDSTIPLKRFSVPKGVYYTSESFFEKKPAIDKPFRVCYNNSSDSKISPVNGYRFVLNDSVKTDKDVFGFFDGANMYIRIDKGWRSAGVGNFTVYEERLNEFFKLSGLGRHPYIFIATQLMDAEHKYAIEKNDTTFSKRVNRLSLHYFSKKREFIKATPSGIGFLLKNDKDLYQEYQSEEKINNEVMAKYLDKMNERYPDWEPSSK